MPNGDETVLAASAFQFGNYFVTAKAVLHSLDVSHSWVCSTWLNGQQEIDHSAIDAEASTFSDGASFANVVLKTLVSVPATGNLTFQCHTGDAKSFVDDIKLIGVEVGSIN